MLGINIGAVELLVSKCCEGAFEEKGWEMLAVLKKFTLTSNCTLNVRSQPQTVIINRTESDKKSRCSHKLWLKSE